MSARRLLAAAAISVSLLAGCASGAPDIAATTAGELQATVQDISTAAAAGSYAQAVTLLDTLQSRLDQALAAGQVTADRAKQIQSAIDTVRGDLGVLVESATPVVSPSPTTTATATTAPKPAGTKPGNGPGKKKGKG